MILATPANIAVFLIGPPGSGKSTWIKNATELDGYVGIVSTDNIIDFHASMSGKTYSDVFKTINFKEIEAQMFEEMSFLTDGNCPIIIDRTNMSRKSRKRILDRLPKDYKKFAVVFQVERDELDKRLTKRAEETGKHIPKNVVDDMLDRYEEPTYDEFDEIFA